MPTGRRCRQQAAASKAGSAGQRRRAGQEEQLRLLPGTSWDSLRESFLKNARETPTERRVGPWAGGRVSEEGEAG